MQRVNRMASNSSPFPWYWDAKRNDYYYVTQDNLGQSIKRERKRCRGTDFIPSKAVLPIIIRRMNLPQELKQGRQLQVAAVIGIAALQYISTGLMASSRRRTDSLQDVADRK